MLLITISKEVVKVMFLHLSVILFTESWSASVHAGIPPPRDQAHTHTQTPGPTLPRTRHHPRTSHPPGPGTAGTRNHPLTSLDQAAPGPGTPPGLGTPPGEKTATAADGTHHTGMHSCVSVVIRIRRS